MKIKLLTKTAKVPTRATEYSAGLDLYTDNKTEVIIKPGDTEMIGTGIAMAIPNGCVGLIFPRSGLSTKEGVVLKNVTGVIDGDYRAEVMLALTNTSNEARTIIPGQRVAQLVVVPYLDEDCTVVKELDETVRGSGGFGHSGK